MRSWQRYFAPRILARGKAYFEEGRVTGLRVSSGRICAVVAGSEDYSVEIVCTDGVPTMLACDCPYADGDELCKHMAAVLYAVDSPAAPPTRSDVLPPEELIAQIPDEMLRPVLAALIRENDDLYHALLLRFGTLPPEDQRKHFRQMLDDAARPYRDRDGEIGYENAYAFALSIAALIREHPGALRRDGKPILAFQLALDALESYARYNVDDSDGGYSFLLEALNDLLVDILSDEDEATTDAIFDLLVPYAQQEELWLVSDFAEVQLLKMFPEDRFYPKILHYIDSKYEYLAASKPDSSTLVSLLDRRFSLMAAHGESEERLDAFLMQHLRHLSIRLLLAERYAAQAREDEAIALLLEGKCSADRYEVIRCSERLIALYEQLDRKEALRAELETCIFTLSAGRLDALMHLKRACTPDQWLAYRTRYLAEQRPESLALMQEEEMWEPLRDAVIRLTHPAELDRYEECLKPRFPEAMRDAYAAVLDRKAAYASDRNGYHQLMRYLKKIKTYPGGSAVAADLAAAWRARFPRRRAMLDELKKAGF